MAAAAPDGLGPDEASNEAAARGIVPSEAADVALDRSDAVDVKAKLDLHPSTSTPSSTSTSASTAVTATATAAFNATSTPAFTTPATAAATTSEPATSTAAPQPLPPPSPPASAPTSISPEPDHPTVESSSAAALVENGDSRAVEPESALAAASDTEMSSHGGPRLPSGPLPGAVHHHGGLHAGYHQSLPGSSSAASYQAVTTAMPTTQYASYPTATTAPLPTDAYRTGPIGSSAMALPSMRTIDPIQHAAQMPHHTMSMSMNPSLTSPVSAGPPFFSQSMSLPSSYGLSADAMARFPLPHDPRIIGGRGPKKEIKRRTKTGCLTCRKRRIKCDETHPTCNNCKKSKRECLGYDPAYGAPPAASQPNSYIQPAATHHITPPPSLPSSVPSQSLPAVVPRQSNSYGNQPPMLASTYAPSPASTVAPVSHSSSVSSVGHNSTLSSNAGTPLVDHSVRPLPASVHHENSRQFDNKPFQSGVDHSPQSPNMRVDQIIDLLGPPPPAQQISHTEETFYEITKVYHEMYAGALSAFMETSWYYFMENGKASFPKDATLIEHMASFLKILEGVQANDHSQMAYSGVVETRIVWQLARTAYQTSDRNKAGMNSGMPVMLPPEGDAAEARGRLQVIDALLCGDYIQANPLAPPLPDVDQHRVRQFDFWYCLAEFVRRRDSPNSSATAQVREDYLSRMRHLLDGRENRDVLYSIAVVRELSPNYEANYGGSIPPHLDETDPKHRLAVASKFIMDEAQVTGGTTNVVRRFSDIACRAFVNPGVNITRRF